MARATEILDLLDIPGKRMQAWSWNPDWVHELDGFDVWATQFYPTTRRWDEERVRPYICVHYDGVSSAADKNPPHTDVAAIERWAHQQGLGIVPLGLHNSLAAAVSQLATCALFAGCDSGFSHIAHSVGCPTYLLEYKLPVVTCHRHKNYVLCKGAGHFTQQADNWLHYLRTLGSIAS